MSDIILETERLFLRQVNDGDLQALLDLFGDPESMKYFPAVLDKQGVIEWINMVKSCYKKDGFGFYTLLRKEDSKIIGYCGPILQTDVDGVDEIEVGYALIKSYCHNGYATEAARECIRYGFNVLKAQRIISLIRPENKPSIRVAQRNAMKWEKDVFRWGYTHGVYVTESIS